MVASLIQTPSFLLFTVCICFVATDGDSHDTVAGVEEEFKTSEKENFEIVYPYIINGDSRTRQKRNTLDRKNPVEISLTGSGETFDLELWENDQLLAPGFKVYRRGPNKRDLSEDLESNPDRIRANVEGCHFTGRVKSHDDRPASISICNGLNGLIRTMNDDYIIEPVKEKPMRGPTDFVGRPHKIYKRSAIDARKQQFFESQSSGSQSITIERDITALEVPETSRARRSAQKYKFLRHLKLDKTVEMLVVVDKNMYHKHGDANITTYTLTLFNMVSQLFRDSSLGNNMNIVLVGLILLEGDERGLNIDYNADETLNSFCSWQSVLVGSNGRQHDHAILLTGLDLCSYKNTPCDTLGFAPIEGMCNRVRSCTVNEDTGLSTAFTIAHEVGHNFGMFHDGEGNYCTQSAGKIMSPTLMGKDGQFHWSTCSKAYLMRFLNTPQSECLSDKPKHVAELKFPDKLPGELYDADIQCKWQFGKRARLCTYDFGKDICKALWCYRGSKRCETKFLPAAEGTSCGTGMWCRSGQCVNFGNAGPRPIDGGWSHWTEWSECSRSCGGGVIERERECSRPLPQYGGKKCDGEEKEFKMCNVQDCHEPEADFHAHQCSSYDQQPFQGWYLQWKPQKKLNDENEPCKLHCIADTTSYVFTIKHTATNGMECGDTDNHVCVDGSCKSVGCDWIVGSEAQNDVCGVCQGDNSTCNMITGDYNEQPKLNTYFPITIIPKSARSIRIQEQSLSSNYLAIRDIFGKYYLNGEQHVAWPGKYKIAGTKFKYSRPYNEPEVLEAEGPLEEELVLEILVQDRNPGIEYSYSLPKTSTESHHTITTPGDTYTWSVSISSCSEPCAGGEKTISALCHKNFNQEVDPSFCKHDEKPETGVFPCNEEPCKARWVPEEWKQCSRPCGGGKQRRKIKCRQKISATVDKKMKKKFCKGLPKPERKRLCNEQECPPAWHAGKWSKCSATCGMGEQKRKVLCRSKKAKGYKTLPDSMCHKRKPDVIQSCSLEDCLPDNEVYDWLISPWGPCSKTCGEGVTSRYLRCYKVKSLRSYNRLIVDASFCSRVKRPDVHMQEACMLMSCPLARVVLPEWHVTSGSECSATCGEGVQTRNISCLDVRGHPATGCIENHKPSSTVSCNFGECLPQALASTDCTDKFDWCNRVPELNFCGHELYSKHCCKSCNRRR